MSDAGIIQEIVAGVVVRVYDDRNHVSGVGFLTEDGDDLAQVIHDPEAILEIAFTLGQIAAEIRGQHAPSDC